MFDISFSGKAASRRHARGSIAIGSFREYFDAPLGYWKRGDYERSWSAAAHRVVVESKDACFAVSMQGPAVANFVFCWAVYLTGGQLVFQNCMVFCTPAEPIFPDRFHECPPARVSVNEEGQRISEWTLEILDLQAWLVGREAQ